MQEAFGIIMAGGMGSRFWPFSRRALPKQFLPMIGCGNKGEGSMLAMTVNRCAGCIDRQHILVVTHKDYAGLVKQTLPWLTGEQRILEPCNRDTAPGIALALAKVMQQSPKAVTVFLPSDHYITDDNAFKDDLSFAIELAAKKEKIVTIGIQPSYPATSYGYLDCGGALTWQGKTYFTAAGFLEKPAKEKAARLLAAGNKLWNSGILISRADLLWKQIKNHLPQITSLLDAYGDGRVKLEDVYGNMPNISIDYGVLEKMPPQQMAVLPASFGWDDVGSFPALARYWETDRAGNAVAERTQVAALDSTGCIISREEGLVALLGVKDLLIVEHSDVLLIAEKGQDQKIKDMVKKIEAGALRGYL